MKHRVHTYTGELSYLLASQEGGEEEETSRPERSQSFDGYKLQQHAHEQQQQEQQQFDGERRPALRRRSSSGKNIKRRNSRVLLSEDLITHGTDDDNKVDGKPGGGGGGGGGGGAGAGAGGIGGGAGDHGDHDDHGDDDDDDDGRGLGDLLLDLVPCSLSFTDIVAGVLTFLMSTVVFVSIGDSIFAGVDPEKAFIGISMCILPAALLGWILTLVSHVPWTVPSVDVTFTPILAEMGAALAGKISDPDTLVATFVAAISLTYVCVGVSLSAAEDS